MDHFTVKKSRHSSQSSSLTVPETLNTQISTVNNTSTTFEKEQRRMNVASFNSNFQILNNVTYKAWIAMAAGICQQILCWGLIMTFGTVLTYYTKHLLPNTSKTLICLVGTIPPFLLLLLSSIWGRLLDSGYHRKINIFAGICITGGLAGLTFTGGQGNDGEGKYWAILLASVPVGIGQSCYFLSAPHMAKTWMPDHKGFAMGVTNSGAAIGGSTLPFVFTYLTAKHDFRSGIGGLAGIALVLTLFIAYAAVPAPDFLPRAMANPKKLDTWIPFGSLRSRTFIVHIAAMCSLYLGILTVPFLIEFWAQSRHLGISEDHVSGGGVIFEPGKQTTVFIVVGMNSCQLPGRWAGSTLCDFIQARKIHLVASVVSITLIATFWNLAETFTAAMTFACLFGANLGVMVSLPINDAQDILTPERTALLGQYAGMVYTCASPFILAGGVISGALVEKLGVGAAGIWATATLGLGGCLIGMSLWLEDDTWKFDQQSAPEEKRFSLDVESVAAASSTVVVEAPNEQQGNRHGDGIRENEIASVKTFFQNTMEPSSTERSLEDAMMDAATS